jgi:hypothetical protein
MAYLRIRGLNRVRNRLADGRIAIYYYAWRGGPRLQGRPGTPEFHASYNEAITNQTTFKTRAVSGTLLFVMQE